jgi:hypothetical protein
MVYLYPAIILDNDELTAMSLDNITFNNGCIIDNDLSIQTKLEDYFKVPILSIQQSTKDNNLIIFYYPNGFVDTNPLTKTRMAVLRGTLEELQSQITYMVAQRPDIKPTLLIDNYIFQCSPRETMMLKNWINENFK